MFVWMFRRLLRPFGATGGGGHPASFGAATIFEVHRGTRVFEARRGGGE